jgi:hypothetical protein
MLYDDEEALYDTARLTFPALLPGTSSLFPRIQGKRTTKTQPQTARQPAPRSKEREEGPYTHKTTSSMMAKQVTSELRHMINQGVLEDNLPEWTQYVASIGEKVKKLRMGDLQQNIQRYKEQVRVCLCVRVRIRVCSLLPALCSLLYAHCSLLIALNVQRWLMTRTQSGTSSKKTMKGAESRGWSGM